jgi:hypothetical protein
MGKATDHLKPKKSIVGVLIFLTFKVVSRTNEFDFLLLSITKYKWIRKETKKCSKKRIARESFQSICPFNAATPHAD